MTTDPTILILLEPRDEAINRIRSMYPDAEIRFGPWLDDEDQVVPKELLTGVDILFCEMLPANFDDFDRIKWIQITSHGYSQVLSFPILERGIRVTCGLGNFDIPIAEWNILMMLMWHRSMLEMHQHQTDRKWDRSAIYQAELRGSVVGFFGYGGLARETARIAKSMGLVIWAMTRDGTIKDRRSTYRVGGTGDPDGILCDRVFAPSNKEEFFSGADYLIVALPLSDATEGLIGERELRLLKSTSVLINPARARIIEEESLLRCLKEKWIRGASLDVHYAYPLPEEHPLWLMPNVILTPHISGSAASTHFLDRFYDIAVQNLQRFQAGEPMLNELSSDQLNGS